MSSTNGTNSRKKLTLLKLGDLYVVVDGYRYESDDADYLFHSHQCPMNLLRATVAVFDPERGHDPHGRLRFVAGIDDTPEARALLGEDKRGNNASVTSFAGVLQLFGTDGHPPDSMWLDRDGGVIPWLSDLSREHRIKTTEREIERQPGVEGESDNVIKARAGILHAMRMTEGSLSAVMRGLELLRRHLDEDGHDWTSGTDMADVDSACKWISWLAEELQRERRLKTKT